MEKKRQETRAADPQFASFEKHSKGIGMKLLMKMGFKPGEGLGRDKSGIAKPIEVKLRPKGQGMGFGVRHQDDEWDDEKGARGIAAVASGASDASRRSDQQQPAGGGRMWKKKNAEARVKREYRTAEEVVRAAADQPAMAAVLQAQPILDMRGPQVRLVTNLEHLNVKVGEKGREKDLKSQAASSPLSCLSKALLSLMPQDESGQSGVDRTPMPELQHNLQLLVDMCEADIQRLDARWGLSPPRV